jgi:hypothetical protein
MKTIKRIYQDGKETKVDVRRVQDVTAKRFVGRIPGWNYCPKSEFKKQSESV